MANRLVVGSEDARTGGIPEVLCMGHPEPSILHLDFRYLSVVSFVL